MLPKSLDATLRIIDNNHDLVWICYHPYSATNFHFQLYYSYFLLAPTTASLEASEPSPNPLLSYRPHSQTASVFLFQLKFIYTAPIGYATLRLCWFNPSRSVPSTRKAFCSYLLKPSSNPGLNHPPSSANELTTEST